LEVLMMPTPTLGAAVAAQPRLADAPRFLAVALAPDTADDDDDVIALGTLHLESSADLLALAAGLMGILRHLDPRLPGAFLTACALAQAAADGDAPAPEGPVH
jgi:hypothetical protein